MHCYTPLVQSGSNDLFKDAWASIKWISCHYHASQSTCSKSLHFIGDKLADSCIAFVFLLDIDVAESLINYWSEIWSQKKMGALSSIMLSVILFFSPAAKRCHNIILASIFYVFSAVFGLTLILTLFWLSFRFIIFQKSIFCQFIF